MLQRRQGRLRMLDKMDVLLLSSEHGFEGILTGRRLGM